MQPSSRFTPTLPPAQEAIRSKCLHPSGVWTPLDGLGSASTVLGCFEQHAVRQPNRLAVQTTQQQCTYAELNQRANHTAHALLKTCGPGSQAIALLCDNDMHSIVTALGVWKAGKFFVLLDANDPHTRLVRLLHDAQASCIVTDSTRLALAQTLREPTWSVINLDDLDTDLIVENPGQHIRPDTPASLTYTSGSTGRPKGVLHTHGHIFHDTAASNEFFHIGPHDRFLHFVLGFEFFASVATGATMLPFDLRRESPAALSTALIQGGITNVRMKPTVFRRLVDTLTDNVRFPALRLLHMVGESVYHQDIHYRTLFNSPISM